MQDQQLDGPTEQSEQSPIWVHDPRSIELRGQWPDAEVTSSIGDTAALIMREVDEMEHRYYARATTGRRAAVHTAGLDRGEVESSSRRTPGSSTGCATRSGDKTQMEKSLSVLTAVAPDRAQFLTDAAASVAAARPALQIVGWELEWIVVVDGPPEIPVPVGVDELATLPAGRRGGVCQERCQSLASGSWVLPLDADDELRGAGVALVLDRITADDEVGWVATNRVFVGGDRTPHWFSDRRSWAVGEHAQTWSAPFVFHPNSVIARRDLSLTCGG